MDKYSLFEEMWFALKVVVAEITPLFSGVALGVFVAWLLSR